MADSLREALSDPGPYTAEALAEKLPDFTLPAIRDALEFLTAQGVLERSPGPDGAVQYRYVAPERYVQANMDAIRDPARRHERR